MLPKPLILNRWDGGIADSPYEGIIGSHPAIVGLDYRTDPGILQLARPMAKVSGQSGGSDVVQGDIKWFINISPSEIYAMDEGTSDVTRILKSTNSGDSWSLFKLIGSVDSSSSANGGIYWKGYFLYCTDSWLGYYKPGASTEWLQGWQDLRVNGVSDSDWHSMLQGQRDGSLYIGNGSHVALLSETADTTFDPTNSATYSFNADALDIPSDFRIKSLSEVGDNLMLGCWKKVGSVYHPVSVLYPWNYVLRPLSHEAPVFKTKSYGVTAQLNVDNVLYAWMGQHYEIYYYNGSEFSRLKRIPLDISQLSGVMGVNPGAVAEFLDIPHFGVDNVLSSPLIYGGIYNYGTSDKKRYPLSLNCQYPISQTQSKATVINSIGVCGAGGNILLAGWQNSTDGTWGIDKINNSSRLTSGAFIETMLFRLGTAKLKPQIEQFEIYLDGNIASGQTIDIKYRRNTGDSWTTITPKNRANTFSYSLDGAISSKYIQFNINNVVDLQFRIEFSSSSGSNIKLREVRIQ